MGQAWGRLGAGGHGEAWGGRGGKKRLKDNWEPAGGGEGGEGEGGGGAASSVTNTVIPYYKIIKGVGMSPIVDGGSGRGEGGGGGGR